jgi:chromosome segregation ATPase
MESTVKASVLAVETAESKLNTAQSNLSEYLDPYGVINIDRDLSSVQVNFENQKRSIEQSRIDLASKEKQLEWWKASLETMDLIVNEPSSDRTDQRKQSLLTSLDKARGDLAATPYLPGTLTHQRLQDNVDRLQDEYENLPLSSEQLNVVRLNPAIAEANTAIRELEGSVAALRMEVTLSEQREGSLEIELNRLTKLKREATPLLNLVTLAERAADERREELIEVSAAHEALLIETESAQRLVQSPSQPLSPDQFGILTSNTKVGFFLSALAALLAGFVTKVRLPRRV